MLWRGRFGAELVHDFHPDVPPNGLFWTLPIAADAVRFDFGEGSATLSLQDVAVDDAVGDSSEPAAVSLSMQWSAAAVSLPAADPAVGFAGSYRESSATIAWSAAESSFTFVSDPDAAVDVRFAQIGQESTGSFASARARSGRSEFRG